MKDGSPEFNRQLEFIIQELNSNKNKLKADDGGDEATSDDEGDEDDDDEVCFCFRQLF